MTIICLTVPSPRMTPDRDLHVPIGRGVYLGPHHIGDVVDATPLAGAVRLEVLLTEDLAPGVLVLPAGWKMETLPWL